MKKLVLALSAVVIIVMLCCGFANREHRMPVRHARPTVQSAAVDDRAHAFDDWQRAIDGWFAHSDEIPERIEHFVEDISRTVDES